MTIDYGNGPPDPPEGPECETCEDTGRVFGESVNYLDDVRPCPDCIPTGEAQE
jgi:hypothetical protein